MFVRRRASLTLCLLIALSAATAVTQAQARSQARSETIVGQAPITIAYEFVTRHIMIPVVINASINGGKPLAFVLDTGDKVGIVDLDRAKDLSLTLDREVKVGGVGADRLTGYFVKGATFSVPGLPRLTQPIVMALPLKRLAARFGHDFDGIIGSDFIREFVVEIDYEARLLQLHDKKTFTYNGPGQVVPISLNSSGHPVIEAAVTPIGGQPITGKYVIDIGSSGSLSLHSPFVSQHGLAVAERTIRAIGVGGAGGEAKARIGRVAAFRIGGITLANPNALFSQDTAGAFANAALHGNIGNQIMGRFKVFLDYGRDRMILEPTARVNAPFDRAVSGVALEASGTNYTTFRIFAVLENSPASDAGLRVGDIITAIDDRQASDLTMTMIQELFEQAVPRKLTIRRDDQALSVGLTPRAMF